MQQFSRRISKSQSTNVQAEIGLHSYTSSQRALPELRLSGESSNTSRRTTRYALRKEIKILTYLSPRQQQNNGMSVTTVPIAIKRRLLTRNAVERMDKNRPSHKIHHAGTRKTQRDSLDLYPYPNPVPLSDPLFLVPYSYDKKSVIATRDNLYRSPHVTPHGRRDAHIGCQST